MKDPETNARLSFHGSIFDDPALFIDRDLSLIEFQRRVFEEARDERNPLLERLRFLSIGVSNLDEFEMVRMPQLAQSGGDDFHPAIAGRGNGHRSLQLAMRYEDRTRTPWRDAGTYILDTYSFSIRRDE